jgi:hypothetical protein
MSYIKILDRVKIGKIMTFLENRASTKPPIDLSMVDQSMRQRLTSA